MSSPAERYAWGTSSVASPASALSSFHRSPSPLAASPQPALQPSPSTLAASPLLSYTHRLLAEASLADRASPAAVLPSYSTQVVSTVQEVSHLRAQVTRLGAELEDARLAHADPRRDSAGYGRQADQVSRAMRPGKRRVLR